MEPYSTLARNLVGGSGCEIVRDVNTARLVTLRCGGQARLLAVPESRLQLVCLVRIAYEIGLPHLCVGRGSNLLISDEGFDGLLIVTRKALGRYRISESRVWAEAGVHLPQLAVRTIKAELGGLAWAITIPGTLGGALFMNAGIGRDGLRSVKAVARRVETLEADGTVHRQAVQPERFGYRLSPWQKRDCVILSAELTLHPSEREVLKRETMEIRGRRRAKFPLQLPNCGSVFKNPSDTSAWSLIDSAGLRGHQIGGARVSDKHPNWIVNVGGASAGDIVAVIEHVRRRVYERTGVLLEQELRIVGATRPAQEAA